MNKEEYPDSLKKLLSEFTVYIKDVRRGAESTIEAYNHDLDTYFEYLQSIGIDLSKPEFSEQLNWGYVTYLRNRKNADSTIQRRFDGQHAFWYFLHKKYKDEFSEPQTIRDCGIRLKNKRNPTPAIEHNEYIKLMRSIKNELSRIG